ncbi:MAG: TnpV protein [Lachnospiraceae bacterium]|nr:TnpV protein [Lachnospiraceae bacterium]
MTEWRRLVFYLNEFRNNLIAQGRYTALWMGGRLNDYLANIDRQAEEMLFQLVKDYAQRQGITERLKAENQMEWVGRMNNCKAQAEEVILAELIYV